MQKRMKRIDLGKFRKITFTEVFAKIGLSRAENEPLRVIGSLTFHSRNLNLSRDAFDSGENEPTIAVVTMHGVRFHELQHISIYTSALLHTRTAPGFLILSPV